MVPAFMAGTMMPVVIIMPDCFTLMEPIPQPVSTMAFIRLPGMQMQTLPAISVAVFL